MLPPSLVAGPPNTSSDIVSATTAIANAAAPVASAIFQWCLTGGRAAQAERVVVAHRHVALARRQRVEVRVAHGGAGRAAAHGLRRGA